MPSRAEKFKPSIKERLAQSAKDKARRTRPKKEAAKPLKYVEPSNNDVQTVTITASSMTPATINAGPQIIRIWEQTTATTNTVIWDTWMADDNGWGSNRMRALRSSNGSVWRTWADTYSTYAAVSYAASAFPHQRPHVEVQESEEQKRARELERQAREELYRKQREAEEIAKEKAKELLFSCLDAKQKDSFTRNNYFDVIAKSGRVYRLFNGTHGNVHVIDNQGRTVERLCIQPGGVPVGDSLLTQKLLIETAEDMFRRHANITLANGRVVYGDNSLLTGDKLADVIPIRPPTPQQPERLIQTA